MNRSDGSLNPIVAYFLNRIKIRPYNIGRAEGSFLKITNSVGMASFVATDFNPLINETTIIQKVP